MVCEQESSRVRLGGLEAGLGNHLGSSAGRHSTEWYKFFTATSHSRSTVDVLSELWSVATLGAERDNEVGDTEAGQGSSATPGFYTTAQPACHHLHSPGQGTSPLYLNFLVCNTG